MQYAKDEEKTEREFYVGGINCNASTARDQFVTVKEQFDKCDGIQAYHGYLSFKDEPNITPEPGTADRDGICQACVGRQISGCGNNPPEHQAPALPLCCELRFLC